MAKKTFLGSATSVLPLCRPSSGRTERFPGARGIVSGLQHALYTGQNLAPSCDSCGLLRLAGQQDLHALFDRIEHDVRRFQRVLEIIFGFVADQDFIHGAAGRGGFLARTLAADSKMEIQDETEQSESETDPATMAEWNKYIQELVKTFRFALVISASQTSHRADGTEKSFSNFKPNFIMSVIDA
jgi:hypothetical protein